MKQDKLIHFIAGIAMAAIFLPFGQTLAILAACAAGIGKEIWDSEGNGTPDVFDALATVAGGISIVAWFYLVKFIL